MLTNFSIGAFRLVEGFGLSSSGLSLGILEWVVYRSMWGTTAGWQRYLRLRWKQTPGSEWWMMSRWAEIFKHVTGHHHLQVGLVCFRLFGSNQLNQKLLTTINASGKLHMVTMVIMAKIAYCVLIFRCQQVSMTISSSDSVSAPSLLQRRILVSAEIRIQTIITLSTF